MPPPQKKPLLATLLRIITKLNVYTCDFCLRVCIAVLRHHEHGNSCKGKHLIGVANNFFHYHHSGTWQCAGRHGAGHILTRRHQKVN